MAVYKITQVLKYDFWSKSFVKRSWEEQQSEGSLDQATIESEKVVAKILPEVLELERGSLAQRLQELLSKEDYKLVSKQKNFKTD